MCHCAGTRRRTKGKELVLSFARLLFSTYLKHFQRNRYSFFTSNMQLLGRAVDVGAYVKRGEESGYIKIWLRGESKQEQITITRKIDTNNKSEWLFNGKVLEIFP